MVDLRTLSHLDQWAYDHRLADCTSCELREGRDKGFCPSARPKKEFNGLMIVGEGPGVNEAKLKTPFIGNSGNLLNKVLKRYGVDRDNCWIANATSCLPPQHPKSLHEDFPNAISSCLPRLETEIDHVRPRVILALGPSALYALTGRRETCEKRIAFTCEACNGAQTVPWWKCRVCKEPNLLPSAEANLLGRECFKCGWLDAENAVQLEPRKRKCPVCDGKKTRVETLTRFVSEHKISFVAGGVFHADKLGYPEGVKYIIPTFHPAHLLRKAETKAGKAIGGQFVAGAFMEHVKKAIRLLTEEADPPVQWREVTRAHELAEYLDAYGPRSRFFGCDIETDSAEPFEVTTIRCVGIHGEAAEDTIVCVTDPAVNPHADELVRALCSLFFSRRSISKCFQNGPYDTQTIWRVWGIEVEGWDRDTLVAHNAVAPDEPHHLQHIVFTYTSAEPWKPAKKQGGIEKFETAYELHEYNARDVRHTVTAMVRLERELEAESCRFVHDLDIQKCIIARGMDRVGLPIDPEKHAFWSERARKLRDVSLAQMRSLAGEEFNPNSHRQLAWALYDNNGPCRLIPAGYTETGAPSTDNASLLKQKGNHEFVEYLLTYRRWDKILGTYIEGMVIDSDWRLRARWNPLGARTGRWSSSPNLMNWPGPDPQDPDAPNMRSMVVAPTIWSAVLGRMSRRKIVGADLSQAELRVFAALSGDEDLINLCKNADENDKLNPEKDPHSSVAGLAFPDYKPAFSKMKAAKAAGDDKEAKKWQSLCKSLREVAKMTIYAMLYAAGAEKIWQGIYDKGYDGPPISVEQVQRVINAFFTRYKGTLAYRERTLAEAARTGHVRDALINRHRVFPLKDVDATVAANFAIQASVASAMDMSIVELAHRLPHVDPSAYIIAQVHDAIYIECDEDSAEAVKTLLEECMSQEIQLVAGAPWMPLPATGKIGTSWDEVS